MAYILSMVVVINEFQRVYLLVTPFYWFTILIKCKISIKLP